MSPPRRLTRLDRLPTELMQKILSDLSVWDLVCVQQVSRRLAAASRDILSRRRDLEIGYFCRDVPGLRRLLPQMSALRRLTLGYLDRSHVAKIYRLVAKYCRHLESLSVRGFEEISEKLMRRLCAANPSLTEVHLDICYRLTYDVVRAIVETLTCLEVLTIDSKSFDSSWLSLMPTTLRRLSLKSPLSGMADLRHLQRCPELRELDFVMSKWLWPVLSDAVNLNVALTGCPHLERLTVRQLQEPLEACLPLGGHPALRHLDVTDSDGVTDSSLRQLPDLLPGLTSLCIKGCHNVTEVGIRSIRNLRLLTMLDLSYLESVSDEELNVLHTLPLEELRLEVQYIEENSCDEFINDYFGGTFTEEGVIKLILRCHTLARVYIQDAEFQDDLIDTLWTRLPHDRDVTIDADYIKWKRPTVVTST